MSVQSFIEANKKKAVKDSVTSKVPASITMAQAILESAAGQSKLSAESNNLFGIKCHSDWYGEHVTADDDAPGECFRKYPDTLQSFADHSKFLKENQRYKPLFALKRNDYKGWANGLHSAGYATDPTYAQQLITIIEKYNLQKLDKAVLLRRILKVSVYIVIAILLTISILLLIRYNRLNNGKLH